MKTAVILGSGGQDGYYLSKLLEQKSYNVVGIESDSEIDICNKRDVDHLISVVKPDELYHLAQFYYASEDHKLISDLEKFEKSWKIHVLSTIYFLEAIKEISLETRIFYAASSHIFGAPETSVQNEETPFNPISIHGITKLAGLEVCQLYRTKHNLFVAVGILFNHESPKRRENFVSKKIVQQAVSISQGSATKLTLGDLNTIVDWGYAGDFVDAMYRMLQVDKSEDFVVATGKKHRVRDFVIETFGQLELDWKDYVEIDDSILENKNTYPLIGDSSKLRNKTGWVSNVSFEQLITIMIESELGCG